MFRISRDEIAFPAYIWEVFFIKTSYNYVLLPLNLITNPKYKRLSSNEKLLYALLLNRRKFSENNRTNFSDEKGVFIYYANKQIQNHLNCSEPTAVSALENLQQAELIHKEYQKRGQLLKIYVNDIDTGDNGTYPAPQKPQDKFFQKTITKPYKEQKPFKTDFSQQEKQVSFDVGMTLTQKQKNRRNFGDKKRKKTENLSQSP